MFFRSAGGVNPGNAAYSPVPLAGADVEGAEEVGALLEVLPDVVGVVADVPVDTAAGVLNAAGFWLLPPHPASAVTSTAEQASAFMCGRTMLALMRITSPPCQSPKRVPTAES